MRRLDGLPQIIPDLIWVHNQQVIDDNNLDELVGHASLVFSLFQLTNGKPFNTREIAEKLVKHPEFKTRAKSVYGNPAMQVIMHYLQGFIQLGLIKYADPIEEEKSRLRRFSKFNPLTMNSKGDPKGKYKHVRVNGRFVKRGDQ